MKQAPDNTKIWSAALFGGFFILLGLLIALKATGVIDLSLWSGFRTFWPVGFILVGIALILRSRKLAFGLLFLTLLLGILLLWDGTSGYLGHDSETREVTQEVTLDAEVTSVELDVDYGAGDVTISKGNTSTIIRNYIKTNDIDDPKMTYEKTGTAAKVGISRATPSYGFGPWQKSEWDMELNGDVIYDIDLDYGATEMKIDLTGLQVDNIDMDFGASETEIIFEDYPTHVEIDTGAASIDLEFPEGANVMLDIDGGAVSKSLDGFVKKGKTKYLSPDYDPDKPAIEIEINAGASSISAEFY